MGPSAMRSYCTVPAVLLAVLATGAAAEPRHDMPKVVVFFTQWSALIDPAAEAAIKTAAAQAKAASGSRVVVTGFADTTGSDKANRLLSQTRATVVADELEANGVPSNRIVQIARGKTPAADMKLESRRVEIVTR